MFLLLFFLEMIAVALKQRITLCYVLFTALIILDILAALGTIASPSPSPFISNEEEDNAKNNLTMNITGTRGSNMTKTDGKDWLNEETTTVSIEMFGLAILLLSNLTALAGLQRSLSPGLIHHHSSPFNMFNFAFVSNSIELIGLHGVVILKIVIVIVTNHQGQGYQHHQ